MTRIFQLLLLFLALVFTMSCTTQKEYETKSNVDSNGYTYETVTNDPLKARIYKLDNGLKVYLAQNMDQPRIMTFITVKVGSKNDPKETTGLAHYFEHIMFKGTDEIGTTNWEEEKKLIQQISDKFEQHKEAREPEEKARIYTKIDSLSQLASEYAIANEYDKSVGTMGAKYTNAFTSYEVTAYMNDIPSNELNRWLMLESERFKDPVLRLFHTELETVYEEFNMGQDNDARQASFAAYKALFDKHPYRIPVIGYAEDLKNPSMVNIMNFKETYYVPNNMAICLMGDLDFEETIQLIDKHWGNLEANPDLPEFTYEPEKEMTETKTVEVFGPDKDFVRLGFRTPGNKSKEAQYLTLIDMILSNQQAGLIDIDLIKKQKVQRAYSSYNAMNDYGIFTLVGYPRQDQSLDEVKDLLMQQIEKVKNGEFEDWLLEAVINNFKLNEIKRRESNWAVFKFLDAFISEVPWEDKVKEIDEMAKITKEELVGFANEFFKNNYVEVYKRTGENKDKITVEKPPITPFDVNRDAESDYMAEFKNKEPKDIQPVFADFEKMLDHEKLTDEIDFYYTPNPSSELAYIYYHVDMGKNHIKKLPLAFKYLSYIGTDQYSLEELTKEFYKIGISYSTRQATDRSYVFISGLDENIERGLELLEHLLANAKADQEAYDKVVESILKDRENNKLNKSTILWSGLYNYAKYGAVNPSNDVIPKEELENIDPQELIDLIKDVFNYPHTVFYYGTKEKEVAKELIANYHNLEREFKEIPEKKEYPEKDYDESSVFFCNYDMVQAHIILLSKDKVFDPADLPEMTMFNQYYGGSMSSIIFQEMRESAGLAYSAYAGYRKPDKKGEPNYVFAFIATQPDKMDYALDKFNELLNDMPLSETSFANSKEEIINSINTERITKDDIFWTYIQNKDLGIDHDYRKEIYDEVQNYTLEDVQKFFEENIKGKEYTYVVLGNKENIDFNILAKMGKIQELTLEEIFNY